MAAWVAAGVTLGLPITAAADHPRAGPESPAGLDHLRQDAKIWKAQANARERWQRMKRSERRAVLRRERRTARRAYLSTHEAAGEPSDVGSWGPPFVTATNYKGYAIHAAMLHTGKVLMWGARGVSPEIPSVYAWLWDPARGYGSDAVRDVTPTDANGENLPIYCSGMSFLPDGRLLAVGGTLTTGAEDPDDEYTGHSGLDAAIVFDPATETWTEVPRPAGSKGRWYPTQVLLPDGRTLVASGFTDDPPGRVFNDTLEIYDAETNSFELLDSAAQQRRIELYPHLFTMPDEMVLLAGPNRGDSATFNPANLADPWTDLPRLARQRIGGNAVLLPEGPMGSTRVATIGGNPDEDLPVASAEMIDLDDEAPSWTSFPGLHTPRWSANTVLLPDRSMVTIGGLGDEEKVDSSPLPERAVELYDPVTESWRIGPSQVETRGYHSTALLLPDGRVLSTGDDRNPRSSTSWPAYSPDDTGEIYSPPYLFAGARAGISSAPEAVRWDVPFGVGATGEIDDAVLIAPSAVTHANDMNQRLVPLRTVAEHAGGVTLQSPPSPAVAPPGWYMLFVLNDGVPSIARWVRLDGAAADAPAVPPDPPASDPPVTEPQPDPERGDRPAETEPDPPATSPDLTAPRLRLAFAERKWLRRLRRSGKLRVKVTVDEPARVELRLLRRTRRVARAVIAMDGGTRTIHLRPRHPALRWLRNTEGPRLRFSVAAFDAAGNDSAWTRVLRG